MKEEETPFPPPRMIELHGRFSPDSRAGNHHAPLRDFYIEAESHLNKKAERENAQREKEWRKFKRAFEKLSPLLKAALSGEGPPLNESDEAAKLVPDEALRKEVVDWFLHRLVHPEEAPEDQSQDIAEREEALSRRQCILKHRQTILDALVELTEWAPNDPEAAEALWESSVSATGLFGISCRKHPEQFKKVAATKGTMPVLAHHDSEWLTEAREQVAAMELGSGLPQIFTPLRDAQGSDELRPTRRWAQAAVAAIDETRWRIPFFNSLVTKLGGSDGWADFAVEHGWDVARIPDWASEAVRLEPLSSDTFDAWKGVIRKVIREQIPEFHTFPEWENQRMRCKASGRDTPGVIQAAILDDIVKAFAHLVP